LKPTGGGDGWEARRSRGCKDLDEQIGLSSITAIDHRVDNGGATIVNRIGSCGRFGRSWSDLEQTRGLPLGPIGSHVFAPFPPILAPFPSPRRRSADRRPAQGGIDVGGQRPEMLAAVGVKVLVAAFVPMPSCG
tara:strand:+ start:135 stop:536 length:402 start_codon:yes stop_codon:yes gene_type:complete